MGRRSAYSQRVSRHRRVRRRVAGTAERPRLAVFRSLRNIYAQVIDDTRGVTLAAAGSDDAGLRAESAGLGKTEVSSKVGALVAKRAAELGVREVVFDRGGYKYHGRVRALAEAAREGGLTF